MRAKCKHDIDVIINKCVTVHDLKGSGRATSFSWTPQKHLPGGVLQKRCS